MIQSGAAFAHRLFSGTGSTYDYMANLATAGFDIWWKRKILEKIPPFPARIIDQACGTGILTFKIARRFPSSRVIGIELREEYLDIAKEKNRTFGLNNVELIVEDYMGNQSICIAAVDIRDGFSTCGFSAVYRIHEWGSFYFVDGL